MGGGALYTRTPLFLLTKHTPPLFPCRPASRVGAAHGPRAPPTRGVRAAQPRSSGGSRGSGRGRAARHLGPSARARAQPPKPPRARLPPPPPLASRVLLLLYPPSPLTPDSAPLMCHERRRTRGSKHKTMPFASLVLYAGGAANGGKALRQSRKLARPPALDSPSLYGTPPPTRACSLAGARPPPPIVGRGAEASLLSLSLFAPSLSLLC